MQRHDNNGLRKVCGCSRRKWAKCKHPWHFNFKHGEKHYRFSLDRHLGRNIESKTEAETEAERLRIAIKDGKHGQQPVASILTVAQLIAQYEKDYLKAQRADMAHDEQQIAVIKRTSVELPTGEIRPLGGCLVCDVTAQTIERFRTARLQKVTVAATDKGKPARHAGGLVAANRNLAFLRAMFNWAVRSRILKETPFKHGTETIVKLGRELPRRRRLEPEEAERLLNACGDRLRPLVEAALETGCRKGELMTLQWWQVRLTGRSEINLPAAKTKTKRDRVVPISTRLKAILEMRRNDPDGEPLPPEAFVFGNELGEALNSIKTAWRLTCRRAKLENLHFHDLRREAGSRWLEGGVPLQTVRDWLGHTNISQTSTYLESTLQGQHEAMRRFEQTRLQRLATDAGRGIQTGAIEATIGESGPQETIN